ncbi:hypothetical protein CapIbe_003308 [Capra ibex]
MSSREWGPLEGSLAERTCKAEQSAAPSPVSMPNICKCSRNRPLHLPKPWSGSTLWVSSRLPAEPSPQGCVSRAELKL